MGKTGCGVEAGGDKIVVFTYPDRVRVGVIGIEDRIPVSAVAAIGYPDFRYIWLARWRCKGRGKCE